MSRPGSGHVSHPKTITTDITYIRAPKAQPVHINAAPSKDSDVSYEDMLVAQYLDELKKAKHGKQSDTGPSPYQQHLARLHIVPPSGRRRPASAVAPSRRPRSAKPKMDPKFIADPSMWDPATPRMFTKRKPRPASAPAFRRRPLSATYGGGPRPASAKSTSSYGGKRVKALYRRQPHTIVVTAFRNGDRDVFARVAAPNLKLLLEVCTDKLGLSNAARRVFLDDGTEVWLPMDIPRDADVYISMGEPFKDPFSPAKRQTKMQKSATWTMNGLVFGADSKKRSTKPMLSKRFRSLIEQARRRILIFRNGNGSNGMEIVADPNRFEDFLVACTAKLDLGVYARVLYDWDGNEVYNLNEAPVLDQCLQTSSTPVLGPLWVSKGEGFSPKGVKEFLEGLIGYTKSKLKEAKHYKNQLHLAQDEETKEKVEVVAILSMSEKEIEEALEIVGKDVEDFTNALNRLNEQLDKVKEMAGEEEEEGLQYTLKHINKFSSEHRMVGAKGLRLKVFENGTMENETVFFFNITMATRGVGGDRKMVMARFLDECSSSVHLSVPKKNPNIRPVAQKIYDRKGKEITDVFLLKYDQEIWLSYGEAWINPFTWALSVQFDKVRGFDLVGQGRRAAVREQLMVEDTGGEKNKPSSWETVQGIPDDFPCAEMREDMDPMEKDAFMAMVETGEVDARSTMLLCKANPKLLLYPEVLMDSKKPKGHKDLWPPDAQQWVISKAGYIYSKAMPQLVLAVMDSRITTNLADPINGKTDTKVEGLNVGIQKKAPGSINQQWKFTADGVMYAASQPELFLTYLGARNGDEDTTAVNEVEGTPKGMKFFVAVCEKLEGKNARAQRWGIKQERFDNLGQWKYTQAQNPEWSKRALSWPAKEDGELNEDFDWPMEGYLVPYAPPLKKSERKVKLSSEPPIRLIVLKNGIRDVTQAAPVVGPDLTNMKNDYTQKKNQKKKKKSKPQNDDNESVEGEDGQYLMDLEFTLFLERCTGMLGLPFAGRRLFDENGKEHFHLKELKRDQLVYVSCGEPWSDPQLSKAEQQRRYLLANLSDDVAQIRQFVALRNPESMVLEVESGLVPGARLVVNECVQDETSKVPKPPLIDTRPAVDPEEQERKRQAMLDSMTPRERAKLRAEERLNRLKWPWERVVNGGFEESTDANGEEGAPYSNKELYQRFKPKSKEQSGNLAVKLQQFYVNDGFIACAANPNLVLGIADQDSSEIVLVKQRPDDINQRWVIHENGLIQAKHNSQMVMSVAMPTKSTDSDDDAHLTYIGCNVSLQRKKTSQFGRANQRWYYDATTGMIQAFHTDQMDREITAANKANVCTYAVMGGTEIDQPGYLVEMIIHKGAAPRRVTVCSSCARAMRGRFKLQKIVGNLDFACAMGTAQENGLKQIGSFKCLNGKVDLSTFEAEHTLEEWQGQLERLRQEMSVRAIAHEISAARVPYTVKVLAYRNGEGRMKPGELIVGSSVNGILEQSTHRLALTQAARRLYTADGLIVLSVDDLIDWVRDQYVKQARKQLIQDAKAKKKAAKAAKQSESSGQASSGPVEIQNLMSKVQLESEEEEEEDDEEEEEDGEEMLLGFDAIGERKIMDTYSKYIVIPNVDEQVAEDGYLVQWTFYAKATGSINLLICRREPENSTNFTLVDIVHADVTNPGEHTIDLTSMSPWQDQGIPVRAGYVMGLYWPHDSIIPFDIDNSVDCQLYHVKPTTECQPGDMITTTTIDQGGIRKYSSFVTVVGGSKKSGDDNVSRSFTISLQAWGSNHGQKTGYIKLDNQLIRDTSFDTRDKHHTFQGLHLATLLRGRDGSVRIGQLERFDNEQESEVKRLAEFLQALPQGTVITGVDAGGTESDLSDASALLAEFGVNVDDLDIGEAMAFVAVRGDAGAVQMKSSDSQLVNLDVTLDTGKLPIDPASAASPEPARKKTGVKKKKAAEKGPYVEPPPVEMVLRYPIEVWVSFGEAFVKPERVEQQFSRELHDREERAAVSYELDKQKHILRQMQGRRFDEASPGKFVATRSPGNPVLIEGNWQEPTAQEQVKHDMVHQLQTHLSEVRAQQKPHKTRTSNKESMKRLYTQPAMKRVLAFVNGESMEQAQYVWGETITQILDNASTRLNLNKVAKTLFTMDGELVTKFEDIERDQLFCVGHNKTFLKPKESQQNIEIKANWGRARKKYGPQATDIIIDTRKNPSVDVDPFGPSDIAGVNAATYKSIMDS